MVDYSIKHTPLTTITELKNEFGPPQNVNTIHRKKLSTVDKIALFVTQRVGTMEFFLLIFLWTVSWLGWNILAPQKYQFDPFPAFVLWLFISNLIQIHLMPLIMVGQNIQSKHSDLRADHDYETDKKAEKEIESILLHLEKQQELSLEILRRIERIELKNK